MTPKIFYWRNGNKKLVQYFEGYSFHYQDGPAIIWYYENGLIESEEYRINGNLHRIDGPVLTTWFDNGVKTCEGYYCRNYDYTLEARKIIKELEISSDSSEWTEEHRKMFSYHFLSIMP